MKRYLLTVLLFVAAIAGGATYYLKYNQNPWTRDGQVRANVLQITPRVTGAIVELKVQDNTHVKEGEVLFVVDPEPYKVTLSKNIATQEQAEALLNKAVNELSRTEGLEKRSPGSVSTLTLNNFRYAVDTAQANVSAARAAVEEARLNLSYTKVVAPVSGYVTNLHHQIGSQVIANAPVVALIDENSFWVEGFFKETDLSDVEINKTASVTLLSDQKIPLTGHVESIGFGISKTDGSSGNALLPNVNPNFQWIRLAQRIPVKIKLSHVPEDVQLRVGTTASVQIHK
ncbi:efflux RND transporter periplasmic adaptor subunit [Vibrio parahaemolyticus]|uniref:efflux RND transporter periplasmic adaptor subunit n=1 Tax=Vibrio mediterranei TaxID=689 RepID=UPI0040687ECE